MNPKESGVTKQEIIRPDEDFPHSELMYVQDFKQLVRDIQFALTSEIQSPTDLGSSRTTLENGLESFIQEHKHVFSTSAQTAVVKSGRTLVFGFDRTAISKAEKMAAIQTATDELKQRIALLEAASQSKEVSVDPIFSTKQDATQLPEPADPREYLRLLQLYHQLLSLYITLPEENLE